MSELNVSLNHLQNTQSIAVKFFSDSVEKLERKIDAGLDLFTPEQLDCIVLICDQFQKLVELRSKSKQIDDLLTHSLPEFFKPAKESNVSADPELARNETVETVEEETEAYVKFVCDVCDEDVSILNGDLNYSTKLHLSSPNHLEAVSFLRTIKEFEASTYPIADAKLIATEENRSSRLGPPDSATDSVENKKHEPPNNPVILLDGTKLEDSKVKFDYTNVLKHITQSNGIYHLIKKDAHICLVCGSFLRLEKYLRSHLKSRAHREKIQEYSKYSIEAKKNHVVTVNPDIFVICNDKLYCAKCRVYLSNPHAFLSHVSEQHEQKLKLDFPIISIGDIEFCSLCDYKVKDGRQASTASTHVASKKHYLQYLKVTTIVQLRDIKFCSLCNVKLFTESQFQSHVINDNHISNLELIQTFISGLKFSQKLK